MQSSNQLQTSDAAGARPNLEVSPEHLPPRNRTARAARVSFPSSTLDAAPRPLLRRLSLLTALGCTTLICGCAAGGFLDLKKNEISWADAENPPQRILTMWQSADGWGVDNRPARGFAGQIYFFAKEGATPVAVHGDVRIFVFDDQGTAEEQSRPIHQFVFEDGDGHGAWNQYLFDSQLGPAYNVFIPYTRKGYHTAECSLRVRLTSPDGRDVFSKMVNVRLPGKDGTKPIAMKKTPEKESRPVAGPQNSPALGGDIVRRAATPSSPFVAEKPMDSFEELLEGRRPQSVEKSSFRRQSLSGQRAEELLRRRELSDEKSNKEPVATALPRRRFRLSATQTDADRPAAAHPLSNETNRVTRSRKRARPSLKHPLRIQEAHLDQVPATQAQELAEAEPDSAEHPFERSSPFPSHEPRRIPRAKTRRAPHPLLGTNSFEALDHSPRADGAAPVSRRSLDTLTIPLPR